MITHQPITCFILSLLLITSCALHRPPAPQRAVRVKILADVKLRQDHPGWVEEVRGLVEAASDYFEREFGIRFIVQRISPWPLEERIPSTSLLLTRLKQEVPLRDQNGSYDLIIVFTGERQDVYRHGRARVDRIGDCQQGLGNYLVNSVSAPFRYTGQLTELELDVVALIHELGHIFGAEHTQDTSSIMHEDFAYRTGFDSKSGKVILKNKFCPFGK